MKYINIAEVKETHWTDKPSKDFLNNSNNLKNPCSGCNREMETFAVLKYIFLFVLCVVGGIVTSCTIQNEGLEAEKLTVAKVQKEFRIGMTSAEVVEVLGSPNMITTDEKRREVWVYDKVSTEVSSSNAGVGVWLLVFYANKSSKTASSSQRTLTIIVKFDENSRVRDFAYRTSSF